MRKTQTMYESPSVELMELFAEQGFAISDGSILEDPDDVNFDW